LSYSIHLFCGKTIFVRLRLQIKSTYRRFISTKLLFSSTNVFIPNVFKTCKKMQQGVETGISSLVDKTSAFVEKKTLFIDFIF